MVRQQFLTLWLEAVSDCDKDGTATSGGETNTFHRDSSSTASGESRLSESETGPLEGTEQAIASGCSGVLGFRRFFGQVFRSDDSDRRRD